MFLEFLGSSEEVIMNVNTVLKKANNGEVLNDQEIGALMLHAIDLLKHFNELTQARIDQLKAENAELVFLPLAA